MCDFRLPSQCEIWDILGFLQVGMVVYYLFSAQTIGPIFKDQGSAWPFQTGCIIFPEESVGNYYCTERKMQKIAQISRGLFLENLNAVEMYRVNKINFANWHNPIFIKI